MGYKEEITLRVIKEELRLIRKLLYIEAAMKTGYTSQAKDMMKEVVKFHNEESRNNQGER